MFPDRKVGQNSGYALLSSEGIIMGIFSQMSQRADIFQLQMYYYAAMRATSLDSLEGLRVLDVSHGQTDYLKFLAKFFSPRAVVGYDSIKKQFTTSGLGNNHGYQTTAANTINLAQLLSREKRFDLILCIETWNKLDDKDRFLH